MKQSDALKVSVIIPNYNYAKYLKKRIKSVLRQTYPVYELIILDDKSTDDSEKIIKTMLPQIKKQHPDLKIKLEISEKNSGKAILQWQKGVKMATGDYVWIAEADDLSSPQFLEEAMKAFQDERVVLSYTESMFINSFGLMIAPNFRFSRDREKTGHFKHSYTKPGVLEIEEILAIRCTIPNVSAVVFKKSALTDEILTEASKYHQVGDWYLYAMILAQPLSMISYNQKSLNKFRIHSGSATRSSNQDRTHFNEVVRMHQLFEKHYRLSSETKRKMQAERERIRGRYSG